MSLPRKKNLPSSQEGPSLFPLEVLDGNGQAPCFLPKPRVMAVVPPVKCQGIKTKLVPFIGQSLRWTGAGRWFEPFLGSGVVLFSLCPERAVASDTNKHIIRLYSDIQAGRIDETVVRRYLEQAGARLARKGEDYYYEVRQAFNEQGNPLDFIFLSRSCFNGLMRFNKKGHFNVPFCRKTMRFSPSYITKICNQVKKVRQIIKGRAWEFRISDWRAALAGIQPDDFVYCDPPYIGRHTDYYNGWTDQDATLMARTIRALPCGFAVSMWQQNKYRANPHIADDWDGCLVKTFAHFYHVGSTESLRNNMTEALIIRPHFASEPTPDQAAS
jgi:DNA adenine methylase